MNTTNIDYKELNSKTKRQLIEEIISLKNRNGKSLTIKKIDVRKSDELSQLIVENSHDGIMIIDDNYRIEYVNKRLTELTGYDHTSLQDQDFRNFLSTNSEKHITKRYNNRINGATLDPVFELELVTTLQEKRFSK